MKSIKFIGLAAVAAMVAMAFVGASSAMAVDTITLCKTEVKNPTELCPDGNLLPAGTLLHFKALNPILKGSVEEKCNESLVHGTTSAASGNPLAGSLSELTFTGACTPCPTVETKGLPYAASVISKTVEGKEEFFLVSKGAALLKNCFGLGINCEFKTEAAELLIHNNGGHPIVLAKEVPLSGPGGLCGTTGKWPATYEWKEPTPLFWVALDKA
jgi:hypothetical protein